MAQRVAVYVLGVTVGPVLVGASISVSTWLVSQTLAPIAREFTLARFAAELLPFVLSTLALALLYGIVPNRRVPVYNAFAGALPAALAFEVAKYAFAVYVRNVPTYEIVYGTLAALPVFLIWIYVCWLIVLAGAAVTATLTLDAESNEAPRAMTTQKQTRAETRKETVAAPARNRRRRR
jgi:membrane protein